MFESRRSVSVSSAVTARLMRLTLAVALAASTLLAGMIARPPGVAAAEPAFDGPVPLPARSGQWKGDADAPAAETTGRLVVRWADGVSAPQRAAARAALGLEIAADTTLERTEIVRAPGGMAAVLEALERRPEIAWVHPEQRMRTMAGPTAEPYFGEQWALHNTGQTIGGFAGVPDVDLNVPEAWEITQGSPNVIVAVIDDGVDLSHPDLAGRIWTNTDEIPGNGIDDDGNGYVDDVNGWDFCRASGPGDNSVFAAGQVHGTHVAGSIAASGNGIGIAGVAPNVTIMPIRFLDDSDPSCGTDSQAAEAIAYAVANGARIVNASWGGYGENPLLEAAIAAASDTLFVAAAGNDNVDTDVEPVSPASLDLPNILSVAAIHNQGHLTEFTNVGRVSVDLVAPGEDILSLLPGSSPPYGYGSGTSMAAPHVSGVAALAASARPDLYGQATALRQHLIHTARAMPSVQGWVAHARMVDARAAVVSRPDVVRLWGADRYATAAAVARATFVPHVPYVFVATGRAFPDALAGGAVAARFGSPLLLVTASAIPPATAAELERLRPYHVVILGGNGAVSDGVAQLLDAYRDPAGQTIRLAGADRYATAAAISSAAFDPGVGTVFIATGTNFPDALAGTPAAGAHGGPTLLVRPTAIPAATAVELQRLQPHRIVILGGSGAVSTGVASALQAYTATPVERWWGADRYATAGAIAAQAFGSAASVYLASGLNYPDALAGGPAAGLHPGPLLLSTSSGLPAPSAEQLVRLDPVRVFVLGGAGVVADSVIDQVNALFP